MIGSFFIVKVLYSEEKSDDCYWYLLFSFFIKEKIK